MDKSTMELGLRNWDKTKMNSYTHSVIVFFASLSISLSACGTNQSSVNIQATVDSQVQATLAAGKSTQPLAVATSIPGLKSTEASPPTQVPPTGTPTKAPPTETPTSTPVPPTPTPPPGLIPFSDSNNPGTLNSALSWQPGGSKASAYDLKMQPRGLTLIAGPNTLEYGATDTAPLVAFPVNGNFVAQVKVSVSPKEDYQGAVIGIRSIQSHGTNIFISRMFSNKSGGQIIAASASQLGQATDLTNAAYADDSAWLRIERHGSLFTLSYSSNGNNWSDLMKDYVFDMPLATEVTLNSYSTSGINGVVAQFYDFAVTVH